MKHWIPRISAIILVGSLAISVQADIFKRHKSSNKPTPDNPLAGSTSKQPDKELFDKAELAMKKGRFDVARLDLQTLLNTYPESEYLMRAKLAVGDSWFREGGTAALTQAEAEYKDFITFFPNQPEAAEAQMKVADIYYMQMEKPDRDPTNAQRAEQEYRTMVQQFPDSPLVPRAKQKLREVQEVLAERQYEIGSFYATHENWPATIARLQTLTDRYPLYSHSDLALIALGDAYAAEARRTQDLKMAPAAKQEVMKVFDDRAADAYSLVVTHYSMAPHVEDARERLIALNRPIPEPTQQEIAESEAQEQSRIGITLKDRAMFLVKHGPATVTAARVGEPTLSDPPQVYAPDVNHDNQVIFNSALAGKPVPASEHTATAAVATAANSGPSTPAADSNTPLQLENVPSADNGPANGAAVGATIVSSGATSAPAAAPGAGNAPPRDNSGAAAAAAAAGVPGAENPGGLTAVGPANNQTLPPIEKPAAAPAQTNDVHNNPAQVQTGTSGGAAKGKKAAAPKYDSSSESSSKHKKKKGLDKINPF